MHFLQCWCLRLSRSTWPNRSRLFALLVLILSPALLAENSGLWLDVPFVRQEKQGCGSAVVSMLMQYWIGQNGADPAAAAQEKTIQAALYSPAAKGVYGSDMERYLHKAGFSTFRFAGDWSDLQQHLSKGRPLIVCLQPKSPHDPLHYVVVTGLGRNQDSVLLNDPARGKLIKENGERFEKEWKATGHWTLLVLPQHGP
jgi:ABC-type bacteriocin/lantibiotic exporter with double-glycine peptidase domain